jgi:hypothetical protein
MRLLFVTWGLPGEKAGSASVVYNLIKGFEELDVVLAGEYIPELEQEYKLALNEGVEVWPLWRKRYHMARGSRFVSRLNWLKVPILSFRLHKLLRSQDIVAVIAIFPNEHYLLAAYLAARLNKKIFFPYFHNSYAPNRRGIMSFVANAIEKKIFAYSKSNFVLTEGLLELYSSKYPNIDLKLVRHTFSNNGAVDHLNDFSPKNELSAAFLGNLNESNLDAFKRLCEAIKQYGSFQITIYSSTPRWFFEKHIVITPDFKFVEMPLGEEINYLRRHDILLLPHGFHGRFSEEEYRTIFPTRTVAYIFSGVPILAHLPRDSSLCDFLMRYSCAEIVTDKSLPAILTSIRRLSIDAVRREELRSASENATIMFNPKTTAKNIESKIMSCIRSL